MPGRDQRPGMAFAARSQWLVADHGAYSGC